MMVCPTCRSQFPLGAGYCPHDGQKLIEISLADNRYDELLGRVLDGRYRIESRIGRGGMGVVYAARHIIIEKPVAVKILREEYSEDPHQAERFVREARAASRIGHPNIIDITDFGKLDNGQIYFVMEYLAGATLASELRSSGALPPSRALPIALQICQALSAAHAKGIVHRDLKPENIFLVNPKSRKPQLESEGGVRGDMVKLLDFGIAKITWDQSGSRLTKVGSIFGTPQYMSPEQSAGKDADHRGDIYALGCIIYEMLTGEVPFSAETFMGTLTKHLFEKPIPPRKLRPDLRIDAELEAVILRALEKDPADRYQAMTGLAVALQSCAATAARAEAEAPPANLPQSPSPSPEISQQVILHDADAPLQLMEEGQQTIHLLVQDSGRLPSVAPALPAGARRSWRWIGGLLAGLLLLGMGIFFALSDGQEQGNGTAPELAARQAAVPEGKEPASASAFAGGAPPAPAASGSAEQSPPQQKRTQVTLLFETIPAAATVESGGQVLGVTPLAIQVPVGVKRAYVLKKAGMQSVLRKEAPRRDQVVQLTLVAKQARSPEKAAAGQGPLKTRYGSKTDLRNPFAPAIGAGEKKK